MLVGDKIEKAKIIKLYLIIWLFISVVSTSKYSCVPYTTLKSSDFFRSRFLLHQLFVLKTFHIFVIFSRTCVEYEKLWIHNSVVVSNIELECSSYTDVIQYLAQVMDVAHEPLVSKCKRQLKNFHFSCLFHSLMYLMNSEYKGDLCCCIWTGFYEERAILLGRLGRHEQALGIYVHVLHDDRLAEE